MSFGHAPIYTCHLRKWYSMSLQLENLSVSTNCKQIGLWLLVGPTQCCIQPASQTFIELILWAVEHLAFSKGLEWFIQRCYSSFNSGVCARNLGTGAAEPPVKFYMSFRAYEWKSRVSMSGHVLREWLFHSTQGQLAWRAHNAICNVAASQKSLSIIFKR